MTYGSNKYDSRNWENGLPWTSIIACTQRHMAAIERGEDYDPESGLLHIDHVQANAHFLSAYYKIYPEGDDRPHRYFNKKVGLDVDEVIADFCGAMMERFPAIVERPVYWNDFNLKDKFKEIRDDRDFWLNIKPKVTSLPFEPHCYITARPVNDGVTEEWLRLHGFPVAPVYTVTHEEGKVAVAKKAGVDICVDDSFNHFIKLNNAGIFCYLMDAPHNQRYDVGFKRIKSLEEIL